MNPFYDTELHQTGAPVGPIDNGHVSFAKPAMEAMGPAAGKRTSARTAVLVVAAVGILAIPFCTLLFMRAKLLPVFIGIQSRPVNTGSAVLAVDTLALTVQSKNASAQLKELFEQAAVGQLARLHRTYSRWANLNHELMGSLLLKLTVDTTGAVVSVEPLASHVTNASFTKTVMADVRKWKFPGGGLEATEITVPLLFVPKGMDANTVVHWERKVGGAQKGDMPATNPRGANEIAAPTGDQTLKPSPSLPHSDRTNIARLSPVRSPKPKAEEKLLIAAKTNRPVAIRESPHFSSKKVHEVDGDTRLSILENRGDWLKVKIADAGSIGFVRKEFVSPVERLD
jgi:Bacterial SH3 domain